MFPRFQIVPRKLSTDNVESSFDERIEKISFGSISKNKIFPKNCSIGHSECSLIDTGEFLLLEVPSVRKKFILSKQSLNYLLPNVLLFIYVVLFCFC